MRCTSFGASSAKWPASRAAIGATRKATATTAAAAARTTVSTAAHRRPRSCSTRPTTGSRASANRKPSTIHVSAFRAVLAAPKSATAATNAIAAPIAVLQSRSTVSTRPSRSSVDGAGSSPSIGTAVPATSPGQTADGPPGGRRGHSARRSSSLGDVELRRRPARAATSALTYPPGPRVQPPHAARPATPRAAADGLRAGRARTPWSSRTRRAPGGIGRARHSRIGRHGTCERNPTHRWSGPGSGRGGPRGRTAVGRVGGGRGCRGRPLAHGRAERQRHARQLAVRARRSDRLGRDAHRQLVPVPGLDRERRRHWSPEGQGAGRGRRGQGARPGRRPRSPDGQLHDRPAGAVRTAGQRPPPHRHPAPPTTSSRRPAPTTRAASGSWSSAAAGPRSASCAGSSRTAPTRSS